MFTQLLQLTVKIISRCEKVLKKLVSSSVAAEILGLSLQGIHYRIKKGQLESIKQDGKIFVYIDEKNQKTNQTHTPANIKNFNNQVIDSKDGQIDLLKKTIKFMKKQYNNEILRLEKNQKQIFDVFQSEVDLLKSAFNEMKNIYKLEHKKGRNKEHKKEYKKEHKKEYKAQIEEPVMHPKLEFIDIKDFFILMKNHNKTDSQIKEIILDKVKSGDKRFIYNKNSREVIIYKSDFMDLM